MRSIKIFLFVNFALSYIFHAQATMNSDNLQLFTPLSIKREKLHYFYNQVQISHGTWSNCTPTIQNILENLPQKQAAHLFAHENLAAKSAETACKLLREKSEKINSLSSQGSIDRTSHENYDYPEDADFTEHAIPFFKKCSEKIYSQSDKNYTYDEENILKIMSEHYENTYDKNLTANLLIAEKELKESQYTIILQAHRSLRDYSIEQLKEQTNLETLAQKHQAYKCTALTRSMLALTTIIAAGLYCWEYKK